LHQQVEPESQLQKDARDLASGLGSFQPFLTDATTAATAATGLTGTGAGTGVGSIASYTSPYQQQVIDATLADFNKQAQDKRKPISSISIRYTWCIWWWT
jgi:hypothetical protein